jgi:hypothetical protein
MGTGADMYGQTKAGFFELRGKINRVRIWISLVG